LLAFQVLPTGSFHAKLHPNPPLSTCGWIQALAEDGDGEAAAEDIAAANIASLFDGSGDAADNDAAAAAGYQRAEDVWVASEPSSSTGHAPAAAAAASTYTARAGFGGGSSSYRFGGSSGYGADVPTEVRWGGVCGHTHRMCRVAGCLWLGRSSRAGGLVEIA
jgi:hypothetical protein